jgi:hypothetical protein
VLMDQNLIAVEWGLLGLFGVVVTLLIPRSDEHYRNFLASGSDRDHQHARRWMLITRIMPIIVLLAVVGLFILGARDVKLKYYPPAVHLLNDKSFWLLAAGVATQAVFTGMVWILVRSVKLRYPILRPLGCDDKKRQSMDFDRKTLIRFINKTDTEIKILWLDYKGSPVVRDSVSAKDERIENTYVSHPFMAKAGNVCIAVFLPKKLPAKAIIDQGLIDEATKKAKSVSGASRPAGAK